MVKRNILIGLCLAAVFAAGCTTSTVNKDNTMVTDPSGTPGPNSVDPNASDPSNLTNNNNTTIPTRFEPKDTTDPVNNDKPDVTTPRLPETTTPETTTPKPDVPTTPGQCVEDNKGVLMDQVVSAGFELQAADYSDLAICTANGDGAYREWFKFTASEEGNYVFSVSFTPANNCVDIYVLSSVDPVEMAGYQYDEQGTGSNTVTVKLAQGQTYYVMIDNLEADPGQGCASPVGSKELPKYGLKVEKKAPPQAECPEDDKGVAESKVKSEGFSLQPQKYDNLALCLADDEGLYRDWFKFTPTADGDYIFDLTYTTANNCLDIYVISDLETYEQAGFKYDEAGTGANKLTLALKKDVTYYILIDSLEGDASEGCMSPVGGKKTEKYSLEVSMKAGCSSDAGCSDTPERPFCSSSDPNAPGKCVACNTGAQCVASQGSTSLNTLCVESACVCDNDSVGVSETTDPSIATLKVGDTLSDLKMCSAGDTDFFKLVVSTKGVVSIKVDHTGSASEIDIYLLESQDDGTAGSSLESSYDLDGTGVNTLTTATDLEPGTYYIAINAYSGFGSYSLSISGNGTAPVCDAACTTNGGKCVSDGVCDCSSTGRSGDNCEVVPSGCATNPCKNGGSCSPSSTSGFVCSCNGTGFTGLICDTPVSQTPGDVWINELHYDNFQTDAGEFVEIAGKAGTSLTNLAIYLYNGNANTPDKDEVYFSVRVSACSGKTEIPNMQNGYGVVVCTFAQIQNGGNTGNTPDGLALVRITEEGKDGSVVSAEVIKTQFLSYEGSFTARTGPASGKTSTDIGVSEDATTPEGYSLQLTGKGTSFSSFSWEGPKTASPGQINDGQSFVPSN